jgi:hypothetical protein
VAVWVTGQRSPPRPRSSGGAAPPTRRPGHAARSRRPQTPAPSITNLSRTTPAPAPLTSAPPQGDGVAAESPAGTGREQRAVRVVVDAARGPFGGLPEASRPDNGLEFVATALARSCGVGRRAAIDTHGPRGADGHLSGPGTEPMSLELFTHRFAEWITDYSTVRVHGELDGQTPLGRWREDTTPLREVPAEALRCVRPGRRRGCPRRRRQPRRGTRSAPRGWARSQAARVSEVRSPSRSSGRWAWSLSPRTLGFVLPTAR